MTKKTLLATWVGLVSFSGCLDLAKDLPEALPYQCFQPVKVEGDECSGDQECIVGLTCFEGACRARAAAGGSCDKDEDCEEGLLCSCRRYADCHHRPNTCHLPETVELGGACGSDESCAEGSCNRAAGYLCTPLGEAGSACGDDDDCVEGLVCNDHFDPAVCRLPGGSGDPCSSDDECMEGLSCNAAFQPAVCLQPGAESAACSRNDDCAWPLVCQEKTCASITASPGDKCLSHTDCGRELVCNFNNGLVCVQPGLEGDACDQRPCVEELICNLGYAPPMCVRYSSSQHGDPCHHDLLCAEGLLCNDKVRRCVPSGFLIEGESCTSDRQCVEGLRCGYPPDAGD